MSFPQILSRNLQPDLKIRASVRGNTAILTDTTSVLQTHQVRSAEPDAGARVLPDGALQLHPPASTTAAGTEKARRVNGLTLIFSPTGIA